MESVTTTIYLAPLGKPRSALHLCRQRCKYVLTQTGRPLSRPTASSSTADENSTGRKASLEEESQEQYGPLRGRLSEAA